MADVNAAVTLIKTGQKEEARAILKEIIRAEPHNIPAWFWMVETLETDADKLKVMEVCLKLNPGDQKVQKAYDLLKEIQDAESVVSTPNVDEPADGNEPSVVETEPPAEKVISAAVFASIPIVQSAPEKFSPPPPPPPIVEEKTDIQPFVDEDLSPVHKPTPDAQTPALDPIPADLHAHKPRKKRSWKWLIPAILISFLVFLMAGIAFMFIQSLY